MPAPPDGFLVGTKAVAAAIGLDEKTWRVLMLRGAVPPLEGMTTGRYAGLPQSTVADIRILRGRDAIAKQLGFTVREMRQVWRSLAGFGIRSTRGKPVTSAVELDRWRASPQGAYHCDRIARARVSADRQSVLALESPGLGTSGESREGRFKNDPT